MPETKVAMDCKADGLVSYSATRIILTHDNKILTDDIEEMNKSIEINSGDLKTEFDNHEYCHLGEFSSKIIATSSDHYINASNYLNEQEYETAEYEISIATSSTNNLSDDKSNNINETANFYENLLMQKANLQKITNNKYENDESTLNDSKNKHNEALYANEIEEIRSENGTLDENNEILYTNEILDSTNSNQTNSECVAKSVNISHSSNKANKKQSGVPQTLISCLDELQHGGNLVCWKITGQGENLTVKVTWNNEQNKRVVKDSSNKHNVKDRTHQHKSNLSNIKQHLDTTIESIDDARLSQIGEFCVVCAFTKAFENFF